MEHITYREFSNLYDCTEGAVRSFVYNNFNGASARLNEQIPADVYTKLVAKYPLRGVVASLPVKQEVSRPLQAVSVYQAQNRPLKQAVKPKSALFAIISDYFNAFGFADVIIWIVNFVTVYSLTLRLDEMGIVFGSLYCVLTVWVLDLAKKSSTSYTARTGRAFLYAVEAGMFFVHLDVYNERMWRTSNIFTQDSTSIVPFVCAMSFAAFTSGLVLFSIQTKIQQTEESDINETYNQQTATA